MASQSDEEGHAGLDDQEPDEPGGPESSSSEEEKPKFTFTKEEEKILYSHRTEFRDPKATKENRRAIFQTCCKALKPFSVGLSSDKWHIRKQVSW